MQRRCNDIIGPLFASGCITLLVLMTFCPKGGWLMYVAGCAIGSLVGYLGYRFRYISKSVPEAWERAKKKQDESLWRFWARCRRASDWFWSHIEKPRAYYSWLFIGGLSEVLLPSKLHEDYASVMPFLALACVSITQTLIIESIRTNPKKYEHWSKRLVSTGVYKDEIALKEAPLLMDFYSDRAGLGWIEFGRIYLDGWLSLICLFVKLLAKLFAFLWDFARILAKLIHSRKRTICAIYGPSGGVIVMVTSRLFGLHLERWSLLGGMIAAGMISVIIGCYVAYPITLRFFKANLSEN